MTGDGRSLSSPIVAEKKARQASKIQELGEALVASGLCSLDEQAKALGLCRSTTWTILRANHKASGLSARTINRMLAAPRLPAPVRVKILEYIDEKTAGLYGSSRAKIGKFVARLSLELVDDRHTEPGAQRMGRKSPHERLSQAARNRMIAARLSNGLRKRRASAKKPNLRSLARDTDIAS